MAELIQYANGVPGIRWPLDKTVIRIGRSDSKNDIAIDDAFASKMHAQIEIVANEEQSGLEYYIRDLQSTNHTYLNQSPVEHRQLSHNDTLVIGKSKFVFISEGTREYISLDELLAYSVEMMEKESEESLSIAVDEITKEFKKPHTEEIAGTYNTETGRYRFSRRLNLY